MESSQSEPPPSVVLVSRVFQPEPSAASFRLEACAEALVDGGSNVVVLTARPPDKYLGDVQSGPEGLTVIGAPVIRDATGYVRGYLPYLSFDLPLFLRLFSVARPAVALVEPPPTTGVVVRLVSRLRRFPYVWYAADIWSDAALASGSPAVVVRLLRAAEEFAIRGAAGVIAVSEGVANRVRELGGRNVTVIPNGIDTDCFRPDAPALSESELEALGIQGPYAIYAGTASEWQGAEIFGEAFKDLVGGDSDAQLVFVGHGSRWDSIQRMAEAVNATADRRVVVQLPQDSPERVASLLAGARCALVSMVPGQGYDFAYPTKVLAALSSGIPVLFAGVGPAAVDIEANGLGQVRMYDPGDIAVGIRELLSQDTNDQQRNYLRGWVQRSRSLRETGRRAARFVAEVARKHRGRSALR